MAAIAPKLLPWFEQHGRKHLPWQQEVTAYRVWVSEIMLQQTRVSTVIPYFERFMDRFPDVFSLAQASVDEVLSLWAGLGYYARGRNLHQAARQVVREFSGVFPETLSGLMSLPGIGRSTAAAILSLAGGQAQAILDGNVKRVLARVFCVEGWPGKNDTLKQLWQLAEQQTPAQQTAFYNQAMMDLGSMVCTRSKPRCKECPLQTICQSYESGTVALFPQPRPKKVNPLRHRWLLLHYCDDQLLLQKRPPSGIWGGLWSLPEIENPEQLEEWQQQVLKAEPEVSLRKKNLLKHSFTHFDLMISLLQIEVDASILIAAGGQVCEETGLRWMPLAQLGSLGLPAPVEKILNHHIDEIYENR